MFLEQNSPFLQRTRGVCLREMRTDRIRETSFACLFVFGLKSHRRATLSHSDPGLLPSVSARKASSDALQVGGRPEKHMSELQKQRGFRTVSINSSEPHMVLHHKVQSHQQHLCIEYTYVLHANTNHTLCWIIASGLRNNQKIEKKAFKNKMVIFVLGHASSKNHLVVAHTSIKSVRILNLHKAYNIRVGLFVESLVSNPSTQAKAKKAGKRRRKKNSFSVKQQAQ